MWQLLCLGLGPVGWFVAGTGTLATIYVAHKACSKGGSSSSSSTVENEEEALSKSQHDAERKERERQRKDELISIKNNFSEGINDINQLYNLQIPTEYDFIEIKRYCQDYDAFFEKNVDWANAECLEEEQELVELNKCLKYFQNMSA